jgi:hypothetical protein
MRSRFVPILISAFSSAFVSGVGVVVGGFLGGFMVFVGVFAVALKVERIPVSDDQSQAITEALHQGKKMAQ